MSSYTQRQQQRSYPVDQLAASVDAIAAATADLTTRARPRKSTRRQTHVVGPARQLNGAAAILALSVLADSAIEHYRGGFRNRAMYAPLAASSLTMVASLLGVCDRRPRRHPARDAIYAAAGATGLTGLLFHTVNVLKRARSRRRERSRHEARARAATARSVRR